MTVVTEGAVKKMKNVSVDSSSAIINWDDSFEDVQKENYSLQSSEKEKYNVSKGSKSGKENLNYDILGFKSGRPCMEYVDESRDADYIFFSFAEAVRLAPKINLFLTKKVNDRKRIALPFLDSSGAIKVIIIERNRFISRHKKLTTYGAEFAPTNGQKKFYLAVKS